MSRCAWTLPCSLPPCRASTTRRQSHVDGRFNFRAVRLLRIFRVFLGNQASFANKILFAQKVLVQTHRVHENEPRRAEAHSENSRALRQLRPALRRLLRPLRSPSPPADRGAVDHREALSWSCCAVEVFSACLLCSFAPSQHRGAAFVRVAISEILLAPTVGPSSLSEITVQNFDTVTEI